jgi:hypothetical protein
MHSPRRSTPLRQPRQQDAKQLVVISPAILGPAYFRKAGEVIGAAAGGRPDREKMTDVLRRHGMTVAAPPTAK